MSFAISLRPMPKSNSGEGYHTHILRIDPLSRQKSPGAPVIDSVEVGCRLDKGPKTAIEEAIKALRYVEEAANLFGAHINEMIEKRKAEMEASQKETTT